MNKTKAVFLYRNGQAYVARNTEMLRTVSGNAIAYSQTKRKDGVTSKINHVIDVATSGLIGVVVYGHNNVSIIKTVNDKNYTDVHLLVTANIKLQGSRAGYFAKDIN